MKICILNNLYKPYNRGGAEKYIENIFRALEEKGHEVFLVSTRPTFIRKEELGNVIYLNSFYFYLKNLPNSVKFFWHIFNMFNFRKYFQIKSILNKENPDIILSNNLVGLGFLLPKLTKKLNLVHIHVLHDIQLLHPSGLMFLGKEDILDTFFAKIYQKINSYFFSSIDYVLSPSQWLVNIHLSKDIFKSVPTKVIFNPIDLSSGEDKTSDGRSINFLFVGQIEEHKGVEDIIKVMNKIINNNTNVFFTIIGAGTLLDKLRSKFKNDRIVFLGNKKSELVSSKMLESDCLLINSSCYENSPTVIYEAAASNLQFIYPDFGGMSEIGRYFEGISFDPNIRDDFEKKVELFLESNIKASSHKQKLFNLSSSLYVDKILELLKTIQKHS